MKITGALNYYRCLDLDRELLAGHGGRPLSVPALFVGGDRDIATITARSALDGFGRHAPKALPPVVLPDCGHWVQQEKPEETNALLLEFLADHTPGSAVKRGPLH